MVTKWSPLPIKEGGTDGTTPKSARRALGISEGVSSDNFVSVKDFPFGAVGDGVTDDHVAEQAVINAGPNIEILFPPAIYLQGTTTLTITKNNTGLTGQAPAVSGGTQGGGGSDSLDFGPTLKYTGTGTAFLLGVNPGVAGTFLWNPQMTNLRLKVATATAIALRAYMTNGGRFQNVHTFGSSGTGVGLKVEGCIDTVFDSFDIQGYSGAGGVHANYLSNGILMIPGFSGSPSTTVLFRNCYLHYCLNGATFADFSVNEDCTYEANGGYGAIVNTNGSASFVRPWFEANDTAEIYFGASSKTIVEGSQSINSGARVNFFDGSLPTLVVLRNNQFRSSNVAPTLFISGGSSFAGVRLVLDNNTFPAGFGIGNSIGISWRNVEVVGMRLVTYRFRQTAVAANTAYNMSQDNGDVNAYQMPDKGHILGSYTYYVTQNITAGTYTTGVKKNGSAVATFTSGANAATPSQVDGQYYIDKFVKGDMLQATVTTSVGFLAINGAFITEVIVAFGEDGI